MNILCSFSFGVFAFHPIPLFIKQILIEYFHMLGPTLFFGNSTDKIPVIKELTFCCSEAENKPVNM